MATFRLRRFSRPDMLRAISPEHLIRFLSPYSEFLAECGISCSVGEPIDYEKLAGIFMDPESGSPGELVDALFIVDEMATPMGMDALLAEVDHGDIVIDSGGEHSPADIAVQVWLADRNIFERKHAESKLVRPRSFEHFQSVDRPGTDFREPKPRSLKAIERDLDTWFREHNRGTGSRVFVFSRDDGVWFLIRHGEPYKREGRLDGGESSSVHYRPEKFDVLIYQPAIGELRINAATKGEKQLYRTVFGRHLFGSDEHFPSTSKYTLEPLRTYGAISLNCVDIEGIDWIRLKEYQLFYPGSPWDITTKKSTDIFALLDTRGRVIPAGGRLVKASFDVKFADSRTTRSVVVRPPNVAMYTRDEDSVLVERWLESRGFILSEASEFDEPAAATLASA